MIYRAIGSMSGSSLDGLDIVFAEFQENSGKWDHEIIHARCYPYSAEWKEKLKEAAFLNALDYQLLHAEYGHYIGRQINSFIAENNLQFKIALICSHGHTCFHAPAKKMAAQLGEGAAIAAETELPVVSDLRSLDVAFGGQGAPIVPIGEKLLMPGYDFFLNLGGIANLSFNAEPYLAFDVCPANRVLNMLANEVGKEFDDRGEIAATGNTDIELLNLLNAQEYYQLSYPKSLPNDFGTDRLYPLIRGAGIELNDAMRTYVEHIVFQIKNAIHSLPFAMESGRLLATGGGAFNHFLIDRLKTELEKMKIEVIIPDPDRVKFKEATVMAFIGVLRWRQEYNVLSSVTGSSRNSIGGALWIGQEA